MCDQRLVKFCELICKHRTFSLSVIMQELVLTQEDLFDTLKKAERNFKKAAKERIKRPYLETRLESLEELWAKFKSDHRAIVTQSTSKDKKELAYFTEDTHNQFGELYISYKSSLKEALTPFLRENTPSLAIASTSEVQLPKIQLPSFTGKYNEWQTFYDMFLSLIHNNKSLAAVQKLHYLKSSLSGEPEMLLRNFSTTELNYEEAWKILTKRYNNKRYNCNSVMKTLFAQKPLTHESATGIKQLLDTTSSCLKALGNLGVDTKSWDTIIIYLVVSKLDAESHKSWENQQGFIPEDLPNWSQLVEFLESRFRNLEMIESGRQNAKGPAQNNTKQQGKAKSFHSAWQEEKKVNDLKCAVCKESHLLYQCKKFGQQPVAERQEFVQTKGLCFNCLSPNHSVRRCRQATCCRRCGRRHHSLLHQDREDNQGPTNDEEKKNNHDSNDTHGNPPPKSPPIITNFAKGELQTQNVLLATAVIRAKSRNGCKYFIRALLDQGSQASFVTEATVQLLGLERTSVNGWVSGLGDGQKRIKQMVSLRVESRHHPGKTIQVKAFILSSLTSLLPTSNVRTPDWLELENLPLADPGYASPGKIDVLLGAEVYSEILTNGLIKNPQGNLIAQNTLLGWILSGKVLENSTSARPQFTSMHIHIEDDFLKKFWEIENEPNSIEKRQTENEIKCEKFYDSTTKRTKEGRFVVMLPFKTKDPQCQYGKSMEIAARKLVCLEKRLIKNTTTYAEYQRVMEEYVTLNHMALVQEEDIKNPRAVYLPHHAVVRDDKDTTKLRVVFNASSKGVNNVSLNDDLIVGPKLQQDLRHLLMRWRTHNICIIADLIKMYRQIRVHEEHTEYQRVLWRSSPEKPIQHYKLLTLTFGTACAPYLAVKTLQRLAEMEQSRYPIAADITKRDYYIDDLMTGCETEDEALHIYEEMNLLMNSGGFQLQKWSSNNEVLLQHISKDKHRADQSVPIKVDDTMKVLGICWNRATDNFEYTVNLPEPKQPITKRQVLSDIARLYDPMGWIAPVVVTAKIIIQKLWKAKLEWDDELTPDLMTEWLQYREDLVHTTDILIPRWHKTTRASKVELHAFSDASRAAYAAAVYLRVVDEHNQVHVNLITAKTKVAQLDKESSIPRLELCGAALAAKLLSEVSQVMGIPKEHLHAWSDSTVVLAWLKGPPSRWATFVSNRVSEILTIMEYEQWGHVSTHLNPADCASRGIKSGELRRHTLWWNGPQWLHRQVLDANILVVEDTHEEERVQSFTILSPEENFAWTKFSSLQKMLRVMSYCKRILNLKLPQDERKVWPKFITVDEINQSLQMCIRQVQGFAFNEDIKQLKSPGRVAKKSAIYCLHPFLDQNGIVRVGGRISQANVSYDQRHPIILPAKSHLTRLLISDAHIKTLHGGPQLMLNHIKSKYWVLRGKEQVKTHYRRCVTCLRYSKERATQLMGQLPRVRLEPSKPFQSTGVDYAGPINIRFSPGRGSKSYKGYICLFVCMVTRAVHLEAVTDLTSKAFIAAFRRFTSRRGHCSDLYSDNGTNFVGADKQLKEMFDSAKSELPDEIAQVLTLHSTKWHFIPPQAPNFGGLWEAGVRCAKSHLKKVIGDSTLTYEELSTVLTQVEACLNSRPLTVLSDNPDDPLPMTPGHFLIGEPLLNVCDEDYSKRNCTALERWNLVQKMVNEFWRRWSKEYLGNLSQRYKWGNTRSEPDVGDIVVIRDDNLPPAKWLLGKIVNKHPGPDNLTRVVTVKCKNGFFKRPMSKICVLTK